MPDAPEPSEDAELGTLASEDERQFDLLLAGFQACAKEAIRFLLEEEGLSPDHPLPAGLNEHLVRQQCHLAGTLHNDSGLGLEESFICSSIEGTADTEETTTCSIHNMDTVEHEHMQSLTAGVIEAVEQTMEYIRNEVVSHYRTQNFATHE